MFCFWILEKNRKRGKLENLGKIGLLRQGLEHPRRGKAEVTKWHPSNTPRHSFATLWRRPIPQRSSTKPRRSYCSQ